MNRRELLKMIVAVTGTAITGLDALAMLGDQVDRPLGALTLLSRADIALLNEIGETIIPATDTPGAKAAMVGEFMHRIVVDCYTEPSRLAFVDGLKQFGESCQREQGCSYFACTPEARHAFLQKMEVQARQFNTERDAKDQVRQKAWAAANQSLPYKDQTSFEPSPSHTYSMIKQLTLFGFFTSKTGMTETLAYLPIPGRYDGNVPYVKGQKAWA